MLTTHAGTQAVALITVVYGEKHDLSQIYIYIYLQKEKVN